MMAKNLQFSKLDDIVARLDLLTHRGYDQQGSWSLGQNCNHLATMMEFSQRVGRTRFGALLERIRVPIIVMHFARTVTALRLRLPTLPMARQSQPVADEAGVERLKQAVAQQRCRVGAGACTTFQLWHCGHHLGFLSPQVEQAAQPGTDKTPRAEEQATPAFQPEFSRRVAPE